MSVQSYDSDWSGSANDQDDPGRGSYSDQLALQWEQDPFETDSRLTIQLLNLYFLNAGRATYGMFPRRPFLAWVETNRDKHQDHLMILYSVLAMGSLFSNDPDKRALGKRFASVASYAAEKRFGKFSLQLCQTRLMLALYYFARGKSQEAWDYCGSALRALSALKLNTEEGVRELVNSNADLDYGFDRWTYEECCRRTFWSGLLMDVSYDITRAPASIDCVQKQRYNGFFGGTLFVINLEDAFVRLPCPDNMYEASTPCDAPFFDDELLSGRPVHSPPLGHMAYLCLISALWGEVLTCTGRAVRRPDVGYERHYDAFYARIYEKLEAWHSILPDNLRYSPQNLDNSILEGYAGTFLSLHALYHAAIIRLNRHVRAHALPTDKIRRNLEQSLRMASSFMSIMLSLATVNRQQRLPATVASEFMFSTPFPGYALMLSIDVLTSAGTVSTLPSLIETLSTTLTCIDELASFWASAKSQQKAVSNRIRQLTDIAAQDRQGTRNGTYGNFWRISNSLETAFGNDDALYKAEDQLLFGVVGQLTGQ
ncbi:c6 transcription factor [Pyrenophora tritici-repentis]|nr:c6 transcription factor [Pyrenophora tritici-repentis]KAI1565194.1 c6 transcription factor [Pyrenophora tritici-repentis]KAI1570175.1 c6 transcription factor [Pyrenophora tritici-repentis]KAI1598458.1 c6 transcription factor [Pyrenophora tritici-repentis]